MFIKLLIITFFFALLTLGKDETQLIDQFLKNKHQFHQDLAKCHLDSKCYSSLMKFLECFLKKCSGDIQCYYQSCGGDSKQERDEYKLASLYVNVLEVGKLEGNCIELLPKPTCDGNLQCFKSQDESLFLARSCTMSENIATYQDCMINKASKITDEIQNYRHKLMECLEKALEEQSQIIKKIEDSLNES